MTTIFISGSREIPFVPDETRGRIDRMINSGFNIVVGDSERGVDAGILRYLASHAYRNVTVYTVHERPRVRSLPDSWDIRRIKPAIDTKTDNAGNVRNRRELETEKDYAMGEVADFGLVVWQSTYTNRFGNVSVSYGSLRNMHQLLSSHKPVVLYKASLAEADDIAFSCHELRSIEDLRALVSSEPSIVTKAYAKMEKSAHANPPSLFDSL